MNLEPMSSNGCCEMSLVIIHKKHCMYLGLCKTSKSILVRVDNRWMGTVPSNTPHSENEHGSIQPYLVAYFPCSGSSINKNKKWLRDYIRDAITKDMKYLYCSEKTLSCNTPREGTLPPIVKEWPYRPVQTDANNCYLRSHNVGYRIRLGDALYQWFRDQECKSFVFSKSNYNTCINK
ncbi:hypothetical protein RFI_38903 [Reticulomyxa filosa]|uniref:Uncharacterized protein n=1 Tax=Reticulomyxa filosa TaxID=46433 RepID=X6LAL8_RETFI|nr:hypothetical protein RFI_38903 [Reticulomyxa filosa]|eukprot:ETN98588.1 hypothetical protein RFI_38903 [Reticulomyxa filosa]